MDIINELGDATLYTLHSHTEFCDGRAQMEAFAREAVKQGFTRYGFTPHSPVPIVSPCNMTMANVPVYLAEVERIKGEYGDRCRFYAGMEVDYLGEEWGPADPYFASLGLDYTIGSVHFIPSQGGELIDIDGRFERFARNMREHFSDDIHYVVETFYSQSEKMLDAGGFEILGHFDKIAQNGSLYHPGLEDEEWYKRLINNYIEKIVASGVVVEINTKAYAEHGRIFPAARYIERLKTAGVPMIVNSDAHVPALINASRDYAFGLLG
ncbi:MAG: histidinol-phosphatase [Bacteroidales bacterium]|nr:histidinol-phosphatase [Bacteroidales bacterium]